MDMTQFAYYALYKLVLTFRNFVLQDTPSFLSLLGCVVTFNAGNTLSLYLTVVVLNEQKKNGRKINKVTKKYQLDEK